MGEEKTRYFIQLAYNGTPFNGWQIQPNDPTVQQELEDALSTVLREKVEVVGCGRTDTGVHASQYFAHFETTRKFDSDTLVFKINCMVPFEIALQKIVAVPKDLHARFSAIQRTYFYFISPKKDPFDFHKSWYMHQDLDIEKMNKAALQLIGKHDFTSFSKLHTQTKTNICTISEAFWEREGGMLKFTISADRFLHNMVRAIVGTLVEVGRKKLTVDDFQGIIDSKSRQNAGPSVPAHGLFLARIKYPNFEV